MSRLNWRLGEIYGDCVEKACAEIGLKVGLVGCHGQTVFHQGVGAKFLGAEYTGANEAGESTVLRATEESSQETLPFPAAATDAPMCAECGGMMTRNGSCYKCENCGGTSGCS